MTYFKEKMEGGRGQENHYLKKKKITTLSIILPTTFIAHLMSLKLSQTLLLGGPCPSPAKVASIQVILNMRPKLSFLLFLFQPSL